jgi:hypothetical protein
MCSAIPYESLLHATFDLSTRSIALLTCRSNVTSQLSREDTIHSMINGPLLDRNLVVILLQYPGYLPVVAVYTVPSSTTSQ